MNLYIFKTRNNALDPLFHWLTANVGIRYRVVGRKLITAFEPHKSFSRSRKRGFHSEVQCGIRRLGLSSTPYRKIGTGGWGHCDFHGRAFKRGYIFLPLDLKALRTKRRWDLVFSTRYNRPPKRNWWLTIGLKPPKGRLEVISLLFDSATDMVMCKMLWHGERDE